MAFLALRRFGLEYPYAAESDYYNWILNGLREFWEIATVLRLAAQAFSKQYCLTPSRARGSCIAWASFKTVAPKLSAALIFAHFVRELAPSGTRFFGYFLFIKKKKVIMTF
jgi:hypothetical protein